VGNLCVRTLDKTKWSRLVSILFFLMGLAVHLRTNVWVWLIPACRMHFLFHFLSLANMDVSLVAHAHPE
jgi:hypothetical protein